MNGLSKRGAGFIASWEAIYLYAYPDPGTGGEPWTIGIGATKHDGQGPVRKGQRITLERAIVRFRETMEKNYVPDVQSAIRRSLAQHELDSLASFHYNTGAIRSGSVDDKLNNGDDRAALGTLSRYNKAAGRVMPGLQDRRAAEVRLWRTGDYGSRRIGIHTDRAARVRSIAWDALPWDISLPAPEITFDMPPITPPLPARKPTGNFLLDLIRFIWSKIA